MVIDNIEKIIPFLESGYTYQIMILRRKKESNEHCLTIQQKNLPKIKLRLSVLEVIRQEVPQHLNQKILIMGSMILLEHKLLKKLIMTGIERFVRLITKILFLCGYMIAETWILVPALVLVASSLASHSSAAGILMGKYSSTQS